MSIELMRLAVLSNIFPLFEVENGETFTQTVIPDEVVSVERYLSLQGRFKHLAKEDINDYQEQINARFERLKERFVKSNSQYPSI